MIANPHLQGQWINGKAHCPQSTAPLSVTRIALCEKQLGGTRHSLLSWASVFAPNREPCPFSLIFDFMPTITDVIRVVVEVPPADGRLRQERLSPPSRTGGRRDYLCI